VAQWAAVFNKTNFSDNTAVPDELTDMCRLIAGSESDRALGTSTVTGPVLDGAECGQFLVDCSSLLREWEAQLNELTTDWKLAKVDSLADCSRALPILPYLQQRCFRTRTTSSKVLPWWSELVLLVYNMEIDRLRYGPPTWLKRKGSKCKVMCKHT
jgi:hypothetical protein